MSKQSAKKAVQEMDVAALLQGMAGVTATAKKGSTPELLGHGKLADKAHAAYQTMKSSEADFKALEGQLLAITNKEYEVRSKAGDHTKSLNVVGLETQGMQCVYSDKFSDLAIEQEPGLKKELGSKMDQYFVTVRKLTVKEDEAAKDEVVKELLAALGAKRFQELFNVKITLGCKEDMDRKQFEIPEDIRTLAGLKQNKAGCKPITKKA